MSRECKKTNYGWIVCLICAMALFCTNGLATTGFAAYQPCFIRISGLNNTQTSSLLTIRQLSGFIMIMSIPHLTRYIRIHYLVILGMLACGLSFVCYAMAGSYPACCFSAALSGVGYGLSGTVSVSLIISAWFNRHRGLALGICMSSTGLSAVAATTYITYMVSSFSLRQAFLVEAAGIFCLTVVVIVFLREKPDYVHTFPIGSQRSDTEKTYAQRMPEAGLIRRMLAGLFFYGLVAYVLQPHLSVLFVSSGFTDVSLSIFLSSLGLALVIGKCIYGELADKIGTYTATWILYGLLITGIFLVCMASLNGSKVLAEISVILMGLGLPIGSLSLPLYAAGIATEKVYTQTVTRFQLMVTLGGMAFGTVPGIFADLTGSYVPAFILMLAVSIACSVLLQTTFLTIQKAERSEDAAS